MEDVEQKVLLNRIKRAAEMSAALMRDEKRTGGWAGSENTAKQFDRLAKDATEALAALTTPSAKLAEVERGWLPIESCPRDRSFFDAWIPSDDGGFRVPNLRMSATGILTNHRGSLADIPKWPTHWMPLPAPPLTPSAAIERAGE